MTVHTSANPDIFTINARLGRGVNVYNALESHGQQGEAGVIARARHFSLIAQAGFQSVRIPIQWSAHADWQPPYTVDPRFFGRVDWVLTQAKKNNLAVVINLHDYHEIMQRPENHVGRFLALWRQIAERYTAEPETVIFDLLNEPKDALTVERWNGLLPPAIDAIRHTNPTRAIIVGPGHWNNLRYIDTLLLPADPHLIVTFHYYQPFSFTHQGAGWVEGAESWLGTTWEGNKFERLTITATFDKALAWAQKHNRPLYMGEFGAYHKADFASRERWTRFVAQSAIKRGMSLAFWQFGADFDLFDRRRARWNRQLLDAVLGRAPQITWQDRMRSWLRGR